MSSNYTPIDDIVEAFLDKKNEMSRPIETEPFATLSEPLSLDEVKEVEEIKEQDVVSDESSYIEVKRNDIEVDDELQQHGVQPTSTDPQEIDPTASLLADEKIVKGLHAPISSSLRWLATLALYLLQRSHYTLKVVRGKVMRVKK
ncbi:hypothetical protein HGB07_03885 [Candidatus Roizmanbacteria bacterium]|nr:hypothetical protein [Candidatus Roizmanbacteria bacterium]